MGKIRHGKKLYSHALKSSTSIDAFKSEQSSSSSAAKQPVYDTCRRMYKRRLTEQRSEVIMSLVGGKSERRQQMKKKEVLLLKREKYQKKLNKIAFIIQQQKEEAKRKKTPIVGDMQPLLDALPIVDAAPSFRSRIKEAKQKSMKMERGKGRRKMIEQLIKQDMDLFQQIVKNPTFSSNPCSAITSFVRNHVHSDKCATK